MLTSNMAQTENMEYHSSTQPRDRRKQPSWRWFLPRMVSKGISRFSGILASHCSALSQNGGLMEAEESLNSTLLTHNKHGKAKDTTSGKTAPGKTWAQQQEAHPEKAQPQHDQAQARCWEHQVALGCCGARDRETQPTALPPKAYPQRKSNQQAPEGEQLPSLLAGTWINHGREHPLWLASGKNCLARLGRVYRESAQPSKRQIYNGAG